MYHHINTGWCSNDFIAHGLNRPGWPRYSRATREIVQSATVLFRSCRMVWTLKSISRHPLCISYGESLTEHKSTRDNNFDVHAYSCWCGAARVIGLPRVPMAMALAEMSVKVEWRTVLLCEPPEKDSAFAPICSNVCGAVRRPQTHLAYQNTRGGAARRGVCRSRLTHPSNTTPRAPRNINADAVSSKTSAAVGGCSGESPGSCRQPASFPAGHARQ